MRVLLPAVIVTAALVAMSSVSGQSAHDELVLTRAQIQTDRQAIVAANLQLSEAESKTFWPLYRAYRQEMNLSGDRFVKLLEDYADTYKTLNDEQASAMLDEWLSIQSEESKIMTRHAKQMRRALPGRTIARFFQIENQLNHILRAQVADEIPLVSNK